MPQELLYFPPYYVVGEYSRIKRVSGNLSRLLTSMFNQSGYIVSLRITASAKQYGTRSSMPPFEVSPSAQSTLLSRTRRNGGLWRTS